MDNKQETFNCKLTRKEFLTLPLETRSRILLEQVTDFVAPTSDRLLTDEEMEDTWLNTGKTIREAERAIAQAQHDLTASYYQQEIDKLKAQHSATIKALLDEIEGNPFNFFKPTWDKFERAYDGDIEIRQDRWQSLRKKYEGD